MKEQLKLQVTENGVEQSIIKAPVEKTNILTNIFEVNGYEINAELLKKGTLPGIFNIQFDLLFSNFVYFYPSHDLFSNFSKTAARDFKVVVLILVAA